jgi:hypothetical protein
LGIPLSARPVSGRISRNPLKLLMLPVPGLARTRQRRQPVQVYSAVTGPNPCELAHYLGFPSHSPQCLICTYKSFIGRQHSLHI